MFQALIAITVVVGLAALAGGGSGAVAGGGGCHREVMSDEAGVAVDLTRNCFNPTVIRVETGGTVTWTNQDEWAHTVTGAAGSFGSYDEMGNGQTFVQSFAEAGVFPYFCVLHPSMVGAVVVGDGRGDPDSAAASITSRGGDDGGIGAGTIAAIVGAVAAGGTAAGMVGRRMLSARREGGAAA